MKFSIGASCSGSNARLGSVASGGTLIETPRLALLTAAGSVPHVTRSVLDRAFPEPQLLLAPLSNCLHLENGLRALNSGMAAFCGSRPQDVWIVTSDDLSRWTPDGHFEGDRVPLWTRHGKVLIDPPKYMELMNLIGADMFAVLADTRAHARSGRKRLMKAAARTVNSLEACLNTRHKFTSSVMGVITGWGCKEALSQTTAAVKRSPELEGVCFAGLAAAEEASLLHPTPIVDQMKHVINVLEPSLLRIVPGAFSPAMAMSLLDAGCDVLDSSLAARLADSGHALVFPLNYLDDLHGDKDVIMNIHDPRYKMDFSPLVNSCECVCCTKHTRAYVHHLRNTHELLAPLLITLHNLHHYSRMFAEARKSMAGGTFAMYRDFIQSQHDRWILQYPRGETKNLDKEKKHNLCKRVKTNSPVPELLVGS